MVSYFDALMRYFYFSGRSTRTQYWVYSLFQILIVIGAVFADMRFSGWTPELGSLGFLTLFAVFFHIVPNITVTVRRLHDTGRSGWWYWISLVPFIGGIWLLVLLCLGPNGNAEYYGEDPRWPSASPEPQQRRREPTRAEAMLDSINARKVANRLGN